MEGVNTVVPVAMATGKILQGALPRLLSDSGGTETGAEAEARARMVEARARRQAEAEDRKAQNQADALREKGEKARAKARVGAATSGLTLSGTSLLSLENLEAQNDSQVNELLGESALRIEDILAGAGEQARSIRLSGRVARNRDNGLGSLLRLGSLTSPGQGGQGQGGSDGPVNFPTYRG